LTHAAGVLVLAALGAAWYGLALHPALTASARVSQAAIEADAARRSVADLVARRDRSASEWQSIEADLTRVAVRLQPPSALNTRLAALAKLAEAEGLAVEAIEPKPAVETSLAVRVPLRLGARGPSPAAIRFLASLKRRFPDVAVEGFDVAGREGEDGTAIRFDCVWYADRTGRPATAAASEP
jgi:hypothetical protein